MRTLRILVVDDDRNFAESLGDVLELAGYEVRLAFSGEEVMERFQEANYDVTFMDVKLPGKNGVESFLEIRKLKPDAKVIMMTGFSVKQLLDQAVENGAWAVLQKPFDMEQVLEKLSQVNPDGILIADDDPDFVGSLRELLEDNGYTVFVAHDGQEALERVRSDGINGLILDLRMPILSGLDVYLALRKSGLAVPTIIVTAYAGEEAETLDRLKSLSITGVLTKPFDPQELLLALEGLIRK